MEVEDTTEAETADGERSCCPTILQTASVRAEHHEPQRADRLVGQRNALLEIRLTGTIAYLYFQQPCRASVSLVHAIGIEARAIRDTEHLEVDLQHHCCLHLYRDSSNWRPHGMDVALEGHGRVASHRYRKSRLSFPRLWPLPFLSQGLMTISPSCSVMLDSSRDEIFHVINHSCRVFLTLKHSPSSQLRLPS